MNRELGDINQRSKKSSAKNNVKTNRNRKELNFHIGMKVYIRNVKTLKTKNTFRGPYHITKISDDKNRVQVENNNEIFCLISKT